jgi:hypothetical protein
MTARAHPLGCDDSGTGNQDGPAAATAGAILKRSDLDPELCIRLRRYFSISL